MKQKKNQKQEQEMKFETVTIRGIPHIAKLVQADGFQKLVELKRAEPGQPVTTIWRKNNV